MGDYALQNYRIAIRLLNDYDPKALEQLTETEASLDKMEKYQATVLPSHDFAAFDMV